MAAQGHSIETLIEMLRGAIAREKIPAEKLQDRFGISARQVNRLLGGTTTQPNDRSVRLICKGLSVDPLPFLQAKSSRPDVRKVRASHMFTTAELERATKVVEQLGGCVSWENLLSILHLAKSTMMRVPGPPSG